MDKNIWMFWDNQSLPYLVDKCIQKIYDLHPEYNITVMNLNNYHEYTGYFPGYLNDYGIAHKADWIRCKVVSKYGGFWIDASIYIKKPLHTWINPNCDLYCMRQPDCENQVENWFFYSPKKSTIVDKWLVEYEKALQLKPANYVKQNLDKYNLKENIDYCGGDYLFHQLALMVVIFNNNYNIIRENYGFNYKPFDGDFNTIKNICLKDNLLDDPLFKFRGPERQIFDNYYKKIGYINNNSLLGELNVKNNYFSYMFIIIYIIILLIIIYYNKKIFIQIYKKSIKYINYNIK